MNSAHGYGTAQTHGPRIISARERFLEAMEGDWLERVSRANLERFLDYMIEHEYLSNHFFQTWGGDSE